MKPMYDQLVFAYKFVRDSVDIEVPPQSANVERIVLNCHLFIEFVCCSVLKHSSNSSTGGVSE